MSQRELGGKKMAEGIITRHSRTCGSKNGGKCSCSPTFQPRVWSPREKRYINGPTATVKAEAKAWRVDALASLKKGQLKSATKETLSEVAAAFLEGAKSGAIRNRKMAPYKPSVVRGYTATLRHHVLPRFGNVRLSELTRNDLQDLADDLLSKGYGPSMVRNTIMPLRAIYARAIHRGEVTINPTTGLQLPMPEGKRDRIATPDEAERLLAVLPVTERVVWATAFYAGLRRGELVALRWSDVDLAKSEIRVERGWDEVEGPISAKSKKGKRTVPIPAALSDYLREHRAATWTEGFVFGAAPEEPLRASALGARGKRLWVKKGLAPITLHECRHTYASLMIAAGVNFKALSEFMGHSDIAITLDRYGHLLPGAGDEAAELLDKYLNDWRAEKARKASLSDDSAPLEVPAELTAAA
jgi:integrase